MWNGKRYKPSKISLKLLLTLTPDILSGKFYLKKSKNISGISPGYPGYIFEGTTYTISELSRIYTVSRATLTKLKNVNAKNLDQIQIKRFSKVDANQEKN